VWWRREMHAEFWWGNLRYRNYCEDVGEDGIIVFVAVRVIVESSGSGFNWLRTEVSCRML